MSKNNSPKQIDEYLIIKKDHKKTIGRMAVFFNLHNISAFLTFMSVFIMTFLEADNTFQVVLGFFAASLSAALVAKLFWVAILILIVYFLKANKPNEL